MFEVGWLDYTVRASTSLMRLNGIPTLTAMKMLGKSLVETPERNGKFNIDTTVCSFNHAAIISPHQTKWLTLQPFLLYSSY
jgi:hypothetical protein